MGPHDSSPAAFQVFFNGEPVEMADGHLPEITIAPEDDSLPHDRIDEWQDMSFTTTFQVQEMQVKLGKEWRCRTRKRFIKLLMGHGLSRNQAAEIARVVPLYHRCGFPVCHCPTYQGIYLNMALLSMRYIIIRKD